MVCRAHCSSLLKLLLILLLSDDSYFDSLLCSFCWSKSLNKYLCLGNLLCSFHFNFWLGTVFISDWGICRLVVLLTILLLQLLLGCLFLWTLLWFFLKKNFKIGCLPAKCMDQSSMGTRWRISMSKSGLYIFKNWSCII